MTPPLESSWYRIVRAVGGARESARDAEREIDLLEEYGLGLGGTEDPVKISKAHFWFAMTMSDAIDAQRREEMSWVLAVIALLGWSREGRGM